MAMAPERTGIDIRRYFTTEGVHPYDEVTWERRDARITNFKDGSVAFEQLGVEVPASWSLNATNILAQKYFRGTLGTPERESSLRQVADRVVDTITAWGVKDGYFAAEDEAAAFADELKHLIITQKAAFNSPVWFNIGVRGVPQQASACQPWHALVHTTEGLVPIGELAERGAVGAKVLDADGVTKIVAVAHNGRKRVLRITTKSGHQLEVTPDHLVWRASDDRYGRFVEAGTLQPGDQVVWVRAESAGDGQITSAAIAEAALAGWMQSDGFVGQYASGTNRSLTIEAMTVTDAELAWVTASLDAVFPEVHRHERAVETQSDELDCRRTRLYGEVLRPFVDRWDLLTRDSEMTVPAHLFTAPLPVVRAYLRSVFQAEGYVSTRDRAAVIGLDMVPERLVRGLQQLLGRFGIFSRVRFKADRRDDRQGCWSLSIRPLPERTRFADEIGFIDPAKEGKLARSLGMDGIRATDRKRLEIATIDDLGEMDVYDIQTESGEYLSGNLRVHNCFILHVEDKMESILNWYVEEGTIFKGGSGAGINLSNIRSSKEFVKGGGTASGPVSFMRGADASAGTIKSGGKTRRAAKMVILNDDHPDLEDFIWCKAIEERKARVLRDAGFDMDLDGKDSHSTQYQNANNSVRVTDEFMNAVVDDADWHLRAVSTGEVLKTVKARDIFRQIAQATWECADPGMQFDTTINRWHTAANTGRINGSNPCCFVGDTLVVTNSGLVRIDELEHASTTGRRLPQVVAYDSEYEVAVEREVIKAWVAGYTTALVEVTTVSGSRLRCTPEHRFLVADGRYVQAQDLAPGVELRGVTVADEVSNVSRIELDTPVAVYDLEVEGVHNFAVCGTGDASAVVVHNSEYMHLDNSACNLASINLLKFSDDAVDRFDVEGFKAAVEVLFTAQEIMVGNADYPTEAIAETSRRFRQLGIGYANLGALLMAMGLPYDSDAGRAWAGAITALMTGHAYATSAKTAARMGPFAGYTENAEHMNRVLGQHRAAAADIDEELVPPDLLSAAQESWDHAVEWAELYGVRNSQSSVLAPTGTIGLLMDCDTTGIEPDLGLVKVKKLVGGGTMQFVNQTIPRALSRLGYTDDQIADIVAYIDEQKTILGAPHLAAEHVSVFACSMGDNAIHYLGHVKMMGAVQPFISGAISKTVNMPEEVSVEDVEQLHIDAWRLGVKAVAIYRDNCKVAQPLSMAKKETKAGDVPVAEVVAAAPQIQYVEKIVERVVTSAKREKLPRRRRSNTFTFRVADCKGYVTVSEYEDGRPGELFCKVSKQGSTLAGIMDAFSIAISIALQHGVPLRTYIEKFTNMRFEPAGMTDDPDIRFASSLIDYIFRRMAVDYLPLEERMELGILAVNERMNPTLPGIEEAAIESVSGLDIEASYPVEARSIDLTTKPYEPPPVSANLERAFAPSPSASARPANSDAPYCMTCGVQMQRAGSCHACPSCGSTSGCS